MKKTYVSPKVRIVELASEQILAGSWTDIGGSTGRFDAPSRGGRMLDLDDDDYEEYQY